MLHSDCGESPRLEVEMDTKHEGLTAAERNYFEHAERAQGHGQTLAEYCRTGPSPHVTIQRTTATEGQGGPGAGTQTAESRKTA
jgi:hypothetical protein